MQYGSFALGLMCRIIAFTLFYSIVQFNALGREILFGPELFERGIDKPDNVNTHFYAAKEQEALFRVYNGGLPQAGNGGVPQEGIDIELPATSAEIWLNGKKIIAPKDFKRKVKTVEKPIEVMTGKNSITVRLDGEPGSQIAVEVVIVTELLRGPRQEAADAAQTIYEAIPGARVHFSQLHGGPISVSGPGPAELGLPPQPLVAVGPGDGLELEVLRASAIISFLEQFKTVWGLQSPAEDMAIVTRTGDAELQPGDPKSANIFFRRALVSQELIQTHQGLPILGRSAIGLFDTSSNLYELITRLIPVPQGLDANPHLTANEALVETAWQLEAWLALVPRLTWLLEPAMNLETSARLLWIPESTDFSPGLRLAYEIYLRDGLNIARFCVDAKTGNVFCASTPLPSDWPEDGVASLETAPDEGGTPRSFPTTRFFNTTPNSDIPLAGDIWIMGFGSNFVDDGLNYFTGASRAQLHDAGGASMRSWIPTLVIPATNGNTWAVDAGWLGSRRAAASAMENLRTTLNWWAMRGWRSWNGNGTGGIAISINNRSRGRTNPEWNAFGGWGRIRIGDGTAPVTMRTLASSPEVVGHEFMHSVFDATTDLTYRNESGAINEALADIFGTALTARGDRFNNSTFGELFDGNFPLRDMLDPPSLGQPDRYSNYFTTSNDFGGVHTNSGILNKAHGLLVQGGAFRSIPVPALGMNNTTQLLQAVNQRRVFSRDATMEEFAVAVLGYCELVELFSRVLGEEPGETCAAFNKAYRAVEILPSFESDIAIDRYVVTSSSRSGVPMVKEIELGFTNKSPVDIIAASQLSVVLTNEIGETTAASRVFGFSPESYGSCSGHNPLLEASQTSCLRTEFPEGAFDGYLTQLMQFTLEVFTPGIIDPTPADNLLRIRMASDYQPSPRSGWLEITSTGVEIELNLLNPSGGFPAGLSTVFLTRTSDNGPLVPVSPTAEDTLESETSLACTSTEFLNCAGAGTPHFPGAVIVGTGFKLIDLPTARLIPGSRNQYEVWFDSTGGLPSLQNQAQLYLLADSLNFAEESDETNNLMCVNCVAPTQDRLRPGVIVRLRPGTNTSTIFPKDYGDAAAKLPSQRSEIFSTFTVIENNLPYILPDAL